MSSFFLIYILAAGAASALFVSIGWRNSCAASARPILRFDPDLELGDSSAECNGAQLQSCIGASLKITLKKLAPVIINLKIKVDVLVPGYLIVPLPTPVLVDMLEGLISVAIHHGSPDRLLMTAWECGSRVAIRITDDVPDADPDMLQSAMHSLMERMAFHGGTSDIDVQPTGTALTIWLAGVARSAAA